MTVGELMDTLAAAPRDAEALVTCPYEGEWSSTCGAVAAVAVVIASKEKAGRERVEAPAVAQTLTLARRSLRTGEE